MNPDESPRKLAERFYDDHDGDVRKAAAALEAAIRENDALLRALVDPLIRDACVSMVHKVATKRRRATRQHPGKDEDSRAADEALGRATPASLAHYPLPGGKTLGDFAKQEGLSLGEAWAKFYGDLAAKRRGRALQQPPGKDATKHKP
jgi:hypothetical protein